jgi:DNA-3-methyladenine glycosylase II
MDDAPSERELTALAARWAPYRHAAALMFWKYYAAVMRKTTGTAL